MVRSHLSICNTSYVLHVPLLHSLYVSGHINWKMYCSIQFTRLQNQMLFLYPLGCIVLKWVLTHLLDLWKKIKNYISFLQLHVTYHDFFIMSTNMMSLAIVLIWLHLFIEIKCIIYFGTHGNHLFIHSYPLSHCAPLMVKYCGTWQNLTKMMQKSVRIMV